MRRLVVVALVVAVLASVAWWSWRRAQTPAAPAGAVADTASAGVRAVRLYFASPDGTELASETRELAEAKTLHERVALLLAELDRGPAAGGAALLPAGTSLLHVYLDEQGLLTLDLSRSFVKGFHGGSTAEVLAVASLVRTLADALPEVRRVLIVSGGQPVATLGGHVPLDRPLDVAEWP